MNRLTNLRLPDPLLQKLKDQAKREFRGNVSACIRSYLPEVKAVPNFEPIK